MLLINYLNKTNNLNTKKIIIAYHFVWEEHKLLLHRFANHVPYKFVQPFLYEDRTICQDHQMKSICMQVQLIEHFVLLLELENQTKRFDFI